VAEPLSRIDRITMVNTGGGQDSGVSRITGEVAKVIAQMPPVVESLTGVKIGHLVDAMRRHNGVGDASAPPPAAPSAPPGPAPDAAPKRPDRG
jgi:flotillin